MTTINIYRDGPTWCYALFVAGEYDHTDTTDATTEAELRAELAARWPDATITRVADVDTRAAAAALGRLGGRASKGVTSPRKARAARRNGAKGGRPRGTYRYCVTDGWRANPRGHVGYAATREEALRLKATCRLGGYITRERVPTE